MKPLFFSLLLLIFLPTNIQASKLKITVIGNQGVIENYKTLVKSKGGDPFAITDYKYNNSIRPSISLLLMVQAIKLGGLDFQLNFIVSPNSGRSVKEVKMGHAMLYQADIWESQFDEAVYKSDPIFKAGQFQKGFFAGKNSRFIQKQQSIEALSIAPILLESTWKKDITSLTERGFSNIKTTSNYESMINMVAIGREELTFLEFPDNDQLVHYSERGMLYPVPEIKISFLESRHFMVSKNHPFGSVVFSALQKGLKILRENKTITRAYTESGVFNSKVETWTSL